MNTSDFDQFWATYPRREGKLDAMKAYQQALKHATPDAILAGAMRYARSCSPERRFQKLPGGWLRAGRWLDELPGVRETQATDWFQECQELHHGACGLSRWRHHERKALDAIKSGMGQ
jgi:hypothetical protein